MSLAAVSKSSSNPALKTTSSTQQSLEEISKTHTNEIVIALCGPIGSPLHEVAESAQEVLKNQFGYSVNYIRISELIKNHSQKNIPDTPRVERIISLIDSGNQLRKDNGPGVLAELAVYEISLKREELNEKDPALGKRICHIVDSIKNEGELEVLRKVYGSLLFLIGVFSPLSFRVKSLEKDNIKTSEVYDLIDRDSGEEKEEGQSVAKIFPKSDYFLRVDEYSTKNIPNRLSRFISLLLEGTVVTPSFEERAIYEAASAAVNSACLSRQVGAAITDEQGNLISTGWNDVPKFGGNLYSTKNNANDFRCAFWNKECHNDKEKDILSRTISDALVQDKVISDEQRDGVAKAIRKSDKINHLIEFSRAVHAEMHAILNAASLGVSVVGGNLFCTTYPCHACARHLVAAGITNVYYIEPYTKSLATRLHSDSISDEEHELKKLRLIPFDGVSPNRYKSLFEMQADRKLAGKMLQKSPLEANVKILTSIESFPVLESLVVEELKKRNLVTEDEKETQPIPA